MISSQRATGSVFGADPFPHPVVQHLRRRPRRGAEARIAQAREDLARRLPRDVAHVRDLHRAVRVQVDVHPRPGRRALGEPQPPQIVLQAPVGVDPRLDAQLARAVLHRLQHPARELLLGVLVRVRRALALAEAAERAPHRAHVRDVDVAVDHERHRLPRQLRAQLVRGRAQLLDGVLGASPQTAPSAPASLSHSPARPFSIAPPTRCASIVRSSRRVSGPPLPRRGMNDQNFALIVSSTPREIHSGSMYCGYTHSRSVSAYPSSRRRLRTRCGEGNGCSGEMWSPFAESPPRSVAPARHQLRPPVREVRGDLDAHVRHPAAAPPRSAASCPTDRDRARPLPGSGSSGCRFARAGSPSTPVRQYSRAASSAICAGSWP